MVLKADLFIAMERFDDALSLAREAQKLLKENLPDDHWRVAQAKNAEGSALAGLGDYDEAEPLLLSSLAGLEEAPIPALAQQARQRLARLYIAWGRPQEAAKYQAAP
jgi:tetratricopeptide (TPR) repeat protein